jgi:hypothetical protein
MAAESRKCRGHGAVSAYAADRGLQGRIDTASGAYTVDDSLIY